MNQLAYMVCMWQLRGIFVSGTYIAIMCEVNIEVGCGSACLLQNVGSIYSFSIMAVWLIFAIW